MPLRNLWSLNPGELRVAEQLQKKVPGSAIYFPVRDVGIDLLVVIGSRHYGVQVKESRYYETKKWHNSWHQVSQKNLSPVPTSRRELPDFFVFLTHVPVIGDTGKSSFEERYLVVPTTELVVRAASKKVSGDMYSFLFCFEEGHVSDIREEPETDYTMFLDRWDLLSRSGSTP